ncbi:hypothetical protein MMC06_005994 [Schaereria dolodes]|nr:hypothetical protein [Schaereria dolodes]
MATSTSIYSPSFEKLSALYESAKSQGSTKLTLPERPSASDIVPNQYLNGAIGMLSESAVGSYGNHHYLDNRLDEVERNVMGILDRVERKVENNFNYIQKQFNAVNQRFTKVDQQFNAVNQRFTKVDQQLAKVDQDVKAVRDDIKVVKDNVDQLNQRFDEARATNFNRFVRVLEAPIEEVAVSVQDRNGQKRYEVGAGFPDTVEDFWLLKSNIAKLASLARHYSIKGWKKWRCLEKPGLTYYDRLEDAVAAYPQRCLRILAAKWGLEYGQLDQLEIEVETEKMRTTVQKRKVEEERESRKVKAKVGNAYESEISISPSENQGVMVRRKTTIAEPEVRVHRQTTLEEVIRQYHVQDHLGASDESTEPAWETSSSAQAVRHRTRAAVGQDPLLDERHREPHISTVVDAQPKISDD